MKLASIKHLYHGTDQEFNTFDFKYARGFKDFGKGFYLTSNISQAQKWAQRKARDKYVAYIYSYQLDFSEEKGWRILELLKYDQKWLDFIAKNRMEGEQTGDYDIIYDRIADNQYTEISEVLRKYKQHKISVEEAIRKISWKDNRGDQYCFKTKRALTLLKEQAVFVLHKSKYGEWYQERR